MTRHLYADLEDLVHAHIAQVALDRVVLQVAVPAVQLQRLVADAEARVGRDALRHRAVRRRVRVLRVHHRGRVADHEPRAVQLGAHVGELELDRLVRGERRAELHALGDVPPRRVVRGARGADRARRDREPATVEPVPRSARSAAVVQAHARRRWNEFLARAARLKRDESTSAHLNRNRKPREAGGDERGAQARVLHRDLEALALGAESVRDRNAAVLEERRPTRQLL